MVRTDYEMRRLALADLDAMRTIEEASFSAPWPGTAYESELTTNRLAFYVGAWREGELLGFGGIWLMVDEAHVTTVAVQPRLRGAGIGTALMLELLEASRRGEARVATLDVRVSNLEAQRLYARLGFSEAGLRRRYYEDNGEDALIMTTAELADPGQQAREALAAVALRAGDRLPSAEAFDVVARGAREVRR
jgi:ribosomal-protein-alanine N-acetyltransferase